MTNPTPEALKLVAEYMGHEAFIEGEPCHESVELVVDADKDSTYNPLTNAEQSQELQDKVKITVEPCIYKPECECKGWSATAQGAESWQEGSTIREAIFQAALAHIKGSTKAEGEG